MRFNGLIVCGLAALLLSSLFVGSVSAQRRDRDRDSGTTYSDTRRAGEPGRAERRTAPGGREAQRDDRSRQRQPAAPKSRPAPARPMPDRRHIYNRPSEREWHGRGPVPQRQVYVPRRWVHAERPHHRALWSRHYGRVWWCDAGCQIGFLFGFTVWAVNTVVAADSAYSFPTWEALEYNRTGETSLWESAWGYVEFTPTRTFQQHFGVHVRYCRDFLRVVVRSDGLTRSYHGTACRNPDGAWWIVS